MASLNISLPKALREYVEGEVEHGGYCTPSEYVWAFIREDQKRKAAERIEALLLEGVNSGEPVEATPAYWKNKREALVARHRKARR